MTSLLPGTTADLIGDNLTALKLLFPEAFREDKIDFDMLKMLLSDYITTDKESYNFTRGGKRDALKLALAQTTGTLRPDRASSKDRDTTGNLYIEGDNLEVLRVLQDSYRGHVKMIYIDPPYNTGKDFVYKDDFHDNVASYKEKMGENMKSNPETNGRYHTDWLNMMYPRLKLARNLLKDDGVIFISIDDNEVHNLRKIADEIFGEENFINMICVNMSNMSGPKIQHAITGKKFPKIKEYLLLYSKNNAGYKLKIPKSLKKEWDSEYNLIIPNITREFLDKISITTIEELNTISTSFELKSLNDFMKENNINDLDDQRKYDNSFRIFSSKPNTALLNLAKNITSFEGEIYFIKNSTGDIKLIKTDFNRETRTARIELLSALDKSEVFYGDHWDDIVTTGGIGGEGGVPYPNAKKPLKLLTRIIESSVCDNEVIIDFFAGSSSTAHALFEYNVKEKANNKFIMVQIPEDLDEALKTADQSNKEDIIRSLDFLDSIGKPHLITEIGKERIRRAGEKIKADNAGIDKLDIGFKCFTLDTTNLKKRDINPANINESLFNHANPIIEGRSTEDMLYEIMLKKGLELTTPVDTQIVSDKTVYIVGGGALIVCLDAGITLDLIHRMIALEPELMRSNTRSTIVLYDAGFATDTDKTNAVHQIEHAGLGLLVI